MKVAAKPRDAEALVVDYLTDALGTAKQSIGLGVPTDWDATSKNHLQVVSDGEPFNAWPAVNYATIRLVARAQTTSVAKALCALAYGTLLAHPGGPEIANTKPLTGPLPARDPDTRAELASATARVTVRTEPIA